LKKEVKEVLIALFLIGICAFLYVNTYQIPLPRFEILGSAFFPRFLLVAIIIFNIISIIVHIIKIKKYLSANEKLMTESQSQAKKTQNSRVIFTIIALGLYILIISTTEISYFLLTAVFIFLYGCYLASWKWKNILPIACVSAGTTTIIYLIFGKLLKVFFP